MKKCFFSFQNAFRGIYQSFKLGTNARIQSIAAVITILISFALGFNVFEWIIVILCIAMVISLETINTAIEQLADEVTKEQKSAIRRIKDLAAGAVLITSIASATVFFLLILHRILE